MVVAMTPDAVAWTVVKHLVEKDRKVFRNIFIAYH